MAELIGWVDPDADTVERHWPDAVTEAPETLASLLRTAWESCEAYAPKLAEGAPVPERYKLAQILQAKALWAMQRQGPGDQFNDQGYSVAIYPLDARIRQLLRPKRPFGGLR